MTRGGGVGPGILEGRRETGFRGGAMQATVRPAAPLPRGRFPRSILAQCRWDPALSLSAVEVEFVHRGAPGDRKRVSGDEIKVIGPGRLELEDASIPYHRVTEIVYAGEVVFSRSPPSLPKKERKSGRRARPKTPINRKDRC